MKATIAVSLVMAVIGTILLILSAYWMYLGDIALETAAALKFRPRVVVYRYDVPIVIQAPQVQGPGLSERRRQISDRRTPVFSRDSQVWAGH